MRIFTEEIPYTPFPAQEEIHDAFDENRYVVINHGCRFGGTRCMIACGIKYFAGLLNEHRDISRAIPPRWVMLAPSIKLGKNLWWELKRLFPEKWIVACLDDKRTMITINGGIIETVIDPDGFDDYRYEDGVDLFTVDCLDRFHNIYSMVANIEVAVNYPGRGIANSRQGGLGNGKAIFTGTPNENAEYELVFLRGQDWSREYRRKWWSDSFPWTDNPIQKELSEVWIAGKCNMTFADSIREQLGDKAFRMRYLAEFVGEAE